MPLTDEQIADGWIEVNGTPSARITGDKDRENPVEGAHTAPSGDEVDRLISQLKAEHQRNGGQGAYAWQSRELCGKAAAALSAMRPVDAEGGWIIGNGAGDKWRAWQDGFSCWVDDLSEATRYYRREDAEAVHMHDEDAWRVVTYTTALRQAGEG